MIKIFFILIFYSFLPPVLSAGGQSCKEVNAKTEFHVISNNEQLQNFTVFFFGNFSIYFNQDKPYLSLTNFLWYVVPNINFIFDSICYGGDSNKICINNASQSLDVAVEDSTFEFNAQFYKDNILLQEMLVFDGIFDEGSLSLFDGRIYSGNGNSSCYNVFNVLDTNAYIKSTYCCLVYHTVPAVPPSLFRCNQFESELTIYDSNNNYSIYAASSVTYILAQDYFEVNGNLTNLTSDDTFTLIYQLGYESCDLSDLKSIFSCNLSLISEDNDLKLLFMYTIFNEHYNVEKKIGRIIIRDHKMLSEEGIPYTPNNSCQNFNYTVYKNLEAETQFCCVEFEKVISTVTPNPSIPSTSTLSSTCEPPVATSTTSKPITSDSNSTKWIIIGVVAIFLLLLIMCGIFVYISKKKWYQRKRKKVHQKIQQKIEMSPFEIKLSEQEQVKMHILPKNVVIDFTDILGTGSNATVYSATLKGKIPAGLKDITNLKSEEFSNTKVALKIPTNFGQDDIEQFVREMDALVTLKFHPHIITFYGWTLHGDTPSLITELASTNLLNYVRQLKGKQIPTKLMISILWQISNALEYLAEFKMVHRDVACRNVLLLESNVAKLGDFGLCCHCNETFTYKASLQKQLPLKWLSIEALTERIFSEKSDVWSFAIMAYEIFTNGIVPYAALSNMEMLQFLKDGNRLEQPEQCPVEVYELMLECWKEDPAKRPNFKDISTSLSALLENRTANYGYLSLNTGLLDENDVKTGNEIYVGTVIKKNFF